MSVSTRPENLNDQVVDIAGVGYVATFPMTLFFKPGQTKAEYYGKIYSGSLQNNTAWGQLLGTYNQSDTTQQSSITVLHPAPSPGVYQDVIRYWEFTYTDNPVLNGDIKSPTGVDKPADSIAGAEVYVGSDAWDFYVFQKAVAAMLVNNGPVVHGQEISATTGTPVNLKNNSRGGDKSSSNYVISVQNADGTWRPAVLDVDYSIAGSPLYNPRDMDVQFNIQAKFRIMLVVNGYDSYNHPYPPRSYEANELMVVGNTDKMVIFFNTGAATIVETFKFPKIETVVVPLAPISSDPLEAYQNSQLSVRANILYDTGEWSVNNIVRTNVTAAEWDQEIALYCKIKLQVVNSGGTTVLTLEGLGPHQFSLPTPGDYTINYITSLL